MRGMFALLLPCALLFGCIVPPNIEGARVLPPKELQLISLVKRGKDYSHTGRFDLAEVEFRKALRLNPRAHAIYNDLGFVLHGQQRQEEAHQMYLKALSLEPHNVVARENLARLLYEQGKLEESLAEYERASGDLLLLSDEQLRALYGVVNPLQQLIAIYRNIATIEYFLGHSDEAICYSWLAHIRAATEEQAIQHARLLLSLERVDSALRLLRDVVIARQGNVSAQILVDYGIALFLEDEYTLAQASLSKALTVPSIDFADRRIARLLLFRIADEEGRKKEALTIREGIAEEDTRLCSGRDLDRASYWPFALHEAIRPVVTSICEEEAA